MVDEEGKKDVEKVEFDSAGEAVGYISLDQARVLAMRTARETPGVYGDQFSGRLMAFEVADEQETEDHYVITLSCRPDGEFAGTPGQEQFFIQKEGAVAYRQVLSLPRPEGGRRIPLLRITIALAVLGAVAVVAVLFVVGPIGGGGEKTAAAPTQTEEAENPIAVVVDGSPTATAIYTPTATLVPTVTDTPVPPTPILLPTAVPTKVPLTAVPTTLEEALAALPKVPLGVDYYNQGDYDKAIELFDEAIRLDPPRHPRQPLPKAGSRSPPTETATPRYT